MSTGAGGHDGGRAAPPRSARSLRLLLWAAVVVVLAVLAVVLVVARGGTDASGTSGASSRPLQAATVLPTPVAHPTEDALDVDGQQVPLVDAAPGSLSILYFGFTHCPDICPINMGELSAALHSMPAGEQARIRVVFNTVDPARDTPTVLKAWLGHYDRSFIGVVPPLSETTKVLAAMGLPAPTDQKVTGGYDVSHPGGMYVFTPDGRAHVMFTAGSPPKQIAHDLEKLLGGWQASYQQGSTSS